MCWGSSTSCGARRSSLVQTHYGVGYRFEPAEAGSSAEATVTP